MAIITISRGTFSGGKKLAELVCEKLGYRCISRRVLTEAAERYGVSEEELSKVISEAPHLWERWGSERMRYLACLRATLIAEVKDDNVVYHGLAGHFLLTGVPRVLRVRVIAGMEFRIKAAMDRSNLTREDAIQFIKMIDEKRARRTRFLYHMDWADPSLYDLVLNLDHLGFTGACEIICRIVSTKQYQATTRSQAIVDNLVLSSHVKAILATDKSISGLGIDVEANDGVITLSGIAESLIDSDKIRKIVSDIPGVKDIDSKMRMHLPTSATR